MTQVDALRPWHLAWYLIAGGFIGAFVGIAMALNRIADALEALSR